MEVLLCLEEEMEVLEVTDQDLTLDQEESLVQRLVELAAELLEGKLEEVLAEVEALAEVLEPMSTVLPVCGNLFRKPNECFALLFTCFL
jgi:hypothetical protein